jgi:Amt family ammonium transporter
MAVNSTCCDSDYQALVDGLDTAWALTCATLVILMQLGFAQFEAGCVRDNNVVCTYAKNLLDFILGVFVASFWGFRLAAGSDALSGVGNGIGDKREHATAFFFHLAFQSASATIVSGAMAERTTVSAYGFLSILVSGFNYCLASRWVWGGGWLSSLSPPVHDFAGSGVVHVIGGFSGLAGAAAVGARLGRWDAAKARDFLPHDIPSLISGVFLLWVGWFGFNCGSSRSMSLPYAAHEAANAAVVTALSGAAGATAVGMTSAVRARGGVVDIVGMANGVLAGLVSITAGADCTDAGPSLFVGAVGGLVFAAAAWATEHWLRVDDVVDAFAVHGACGVWGLVAVGLVHRDAGLLVGGGGGLLGSQLVGALALAALGAVPTAVVAGVMQRAGVLRASAEDERRGLDVEFGLSAHRLRSEALARCAVSAAALQACGYDPAQVLGALTSLRGIIYRPFTPQAADHKLEGEVADVLDHCQGHAQRDETGPPGERPNPPTRRTHFGFLSHHKADAGDAARIFVDTARRIVAGREDQATYGKIEDLIFLDSTHLKELGKLLDFVHASANYILMLSRSTLERPWVLAELCAAHREGLNVVVVLVEYQGHEVDPRAFRFPLDLEAAISDWTEYFLLDQRNRLRATAVRAQGAGSASIVPDRHEEEESGENNAKRVMVRPKSTEWVYAESLVSPGGSFDR